MLRTVRTVIVDEIHAVIGTRRGAHLSLSLERLQHVAGRPLLRFGLSATQKPIEEVAALAVGHERSAACAIVDEGHRAARSISASRSRDRELDAVMSHEVWEEYYDRLAALDRRRTGPRWSSSTRATWRSAWRATLSERLGEEAVTAHHGSLSKEKRLDAETRLKSGQLRALVATASLELGIDIGHVDLVCQIGSPHRIATLLQRVGRSGHTISGTPKGRLFPVSRDDLIECAALLRSVRRGELDAIVQHDAPLDVLAQQIVAEVGAASELATRRRPLRARARAPGRTARSTRADFDAVVTMAAEGFSTRRGRRAALLHRDEVHGTRARPARRAAARADLGRRHPRDRRLPRRARSRRDVRRHAERGLRHREQRRRHLPARQRVLADPAGDRGTVRVADAKGAPPTIPFWLGEAPARSDELSRAVSDLRAEADRGETRLPPDARRRRRG